MPGVKRHIILRTYIRVRLDLNKERRIDQLAHLDHGHGGLDFPENFTMHLADGLPLADVGDMKTGANDVAQFGAAFSSAS